MNRVGIIVAIARHRRVWVVPMVCAAPEDTGLSVEKDIINDNWHAFAAKRSVSFAGI